MARLFPKGQTLMPYSRTLLEKAVAASKGKMKPGCKFRCTMFSSDPTSWWSLPSTFSCRFVELDEGIRIDYRVFPGFLVWALLILPLVVVAATVLLKLDAELTTPMGVLIAVVVFAYGFQREKAIERFEKRFGK